MKVLSLLTALAFSVTAVYASPKPDACPPIDKIMTTGLGIVNQDTTNNVYYTAQLSDYGSPFVWGMMIVIPMNQATDQADVMNKATVALSSLSDPVMHEIDNHWVCIYNNSYHYVAMAITPIFSKI